MMKLFGLKELLFHRLKMFLGLLFNGCLINVQCQLFSFFFSLKKNRLVYKPV